MRSPAPAAVLAAAALVLLPLSWSTLHAQSGDSRLTGVVTDTSGAVLVGAVVEATDTVSRRVVVTATTDASGGFELAAPPGVYVLRIALQGFEPAQRDWRADTGQAARIDVVLGPASVTEHVVAVPAPVGPRPADVGLASDTLPTAVSVIEARELSTMNALRDPGDLYRRVPGVLAHNIDQGDTGTSIKMRGFLTFMHGADVAVYVDGIAQNLPSSAINHGMNDMSWLTPEMIERIEVIKGPVSALHGDQNRAGAINIITRSASVNSASVTVGRFGAARGSVVLSGRRGRLQGIAVGDLFRIDGYRAQAGQTRGNLFAKASFAHTSGLWALRTSYQTADWDAPGFLNQASVAAGLVGRRDRDPNTPPLYGSGERASVVLTRQPAAGEAGLHVSLAFEDYARTRALGANQSDLNVLDDDRRIVSARVLENLVWGTRAALAFGAEVRGDRGDAINRRWIGTTTPSANYTFNQDLDLRAAGLFAQGQWRAVDGLKLVAGLRVDGFDHDIRNRKRPDASARYRHGVTTPKGGVVWTVIPGVDLFANAAQGMRSPNHTELSPSGTLGPLGESGGAPQVDLAVSTVTSYDAGVSARIGPHWRVAAAAYHTLNRNEVMQVAQGVFESVGSTTRRGLELEATVTGSRASAYGSYGHIARARIDSAAPGAANVLSVPAHTVKGGVATAIGGVTLNADAFVISGIPYFAGTPLTRRQSRAYARYDVRATFDVGPSSLTAFATFQPFEDISEVALGSAAGLLYDPRPRADAGLSLRWRF